MPLFWLFRVLTSISAFLLTLRFDWALTIRFTVPRGYSFCVAAIVIGSVEERLSIDEPGGKEDDGLPMLVDHHSKPSFLISFGLACLCNTFYQYIACFDTI